jgi:uncharacterized protein
MIAFSPKPPMNLSKRPHGLSKQHVITLGALRLVPDLSGALYMPDDATLLVADLHLEQGASLARRGIHVPPYDTLATLQQLEQVLEATKARQLILLGDSFHDSRAHGEIDVSVRQRLLAITSSVSTIWISGNHDPLPPEGLGGTMLDELSLGALVLRHIPGEVVDGSFEIAGHLHPGAAIIQRNHRVHTKCFVSDGRRLIMPAFGTYTGALNVRSKAFAGLLETETCKLWMIGKTAIHCFPLSRAG